MKFILLWLLAISFLFSCVRDNELGSTMESSEFQYFGTDNNALQLIAHLKQIDTEKFFNKELYIKYGKFDWEKGLL